MLLLLLGSAGASKSVYQVGLYFVALQPILSFWMAMTKSDVKKYTLKLITFAYILDRKKEEGGDMIINQK